MSRRKLKVLDVHAFVNDKTNMDRLKELYPDEAKIKRPKKTKPLGIWAEFPLKHAADKDPLKNKV